MGKEKSKRNKGRPPKERRPGCSIGAIRDRLRVVEKHLNVTGGKRGRERGGKSTPV